MELVIAFALVASFFMGLSIGASSVAPAFAPVNSSGPSSVLRLALIAGIFAFIGSVVQGGNVTETVGAGILTDDIDVLQAASILLVGSTLVIVSVLTDYPMPTAFTVVGAVIGSGLGFGSEVIWGSVGEIVLFWIATPFLSAGLGYVFAKILRKYIPKEGSERLINYLLLISGSYVAYTAGAASVGLAVGPLGSLDYSLIILLIFGGFSILLGSWLYSPRIIKAVSYDYSNIGPRRSVAALASSGLLAQAGIQLGIPVSFNLAIVAAVIGSGLVEGKENKGDEKIIYTVTAWIGAFILAILLTYTLGLIATNYL